MKNLKRKDLNAGSQYFRTRLFLGKNFEKSHICKIVKFSNLL